MLYTGISTIFVEIQWAAVALPTDSHCYAAGDVRLGFPPALQTENCADRLAIKIPLRGYVSQMLAATIPGSTYGSPTIVGN